MLVRFYGGGVDAWLNTSMRWIHIMAENIEQIRAEENLNAGAVALAAANPGAMKATITEWERLARADRPDTSATSTEAGFDLVMARLGIEEIKL